MRIHHLSVRVKDLEKSLRFYEMVAGLVPAEHIMDGPAEIVFMQDMEGVPQIELVHVPEDGTVETTGMFICFGADDLELVHQMATLQGMGPSEIRQPQADIKYFYVYDPDGVLVQFREYK